MTGLIGSPSPGDSDGDTSPLLVDMEREEADAVFAALSSSTARQLLQSLHETPAVPANLADEVDTSLQNVHHHLDCLEDADLIEPVDTWYSSRGTEMTVYAPTSDPLVLVSGEDERTREAIERMP